MPNWCSTSYIFEGSKEEIDHLYKKLEYLEDTDDDLIENDFGSTFLGNVVKIFGGDYEEIYCRGSFENLSRNSDTELSFDTETAWGEMDDVWKFVKSKYSTIRYYWTSEEPGCEHYWTNDREGKHFSYRFIVEIMDEDTEYYDTIEEVYSLVSNRLGYTVANKQDMEEALKKFNEQQEEDYIYFHEVLLDEENAENGSEFDPELQTSIGQIPC